MSGTSAPPTAARGLLSRRLRDVSGALLIAGRLRVRPGVRARAVLRASCASESLSVPLLESDPEEDDPLEAEAPPAEPGREGPRRDLAVCGAAPIVPGRDPSALRAMMLELTSAAAFSSPLRSTTGAAAGLSRALRRRLVDRRTPLRELRVLRALRVLFGRAVRSPLSMVSTDPKSSSSRQCGLVDGFPVE